MATVPPPNPVIGDLVLVGPGVNLDPGTYVVIGAAAAAGPYTVAPIDNPRQAHAGTVPKSRILYVYRAA